MNDKKVAANALRMIGQNIESSGAQTLFVESPSLIRATVQTLVLHQDMGGAFDIVVMVRDASHSGERDAATWAMLLYFIAEMLED